MTRSRKAFSLMEMIMAAILIGIAFGSIFQMHNSSLTIATKTKEIGTASEDAGNIMEKIDAADFSTLAIGFPNNCCVGACGNAAACPGANDVVTANQLLLLNEKIEVNYPLGAGVDPLGIQVKVSWTGRDGREHRDGASGLPVILTNIDTK